jgi:hypothetical protein
LRRWLQVECAGWTPMWCRCTKFACRVCDWKFHFGGTEPYLPDKRTRPAHLEESWPTLSRERDINNRCYLYGIRPSYGKARFCSSDCLSCPSLSLGHMHSPALQQFDMNGTIRK